jgi:hypothetical protein
MTDDLREIAGTHPRSQRTTALGDGIGYALTEARQSVIRTHEPCSHGSLLFREGHQVAIRLLAP